MNFIELDEQNRSFVFKFTSSDAKTLVSAKLSHYSNKLKNWRGTADGAVPGFDAPAKLEFIFHFAPVGRYETKILAHTIIRHLPLMEHLLSASKRPWTDHSNMQIILNGNSHTLQHVKVLLQERGTDWQSYVLHSWSRMCLWVCGARGARDASDGCNLFTQHNEHSIVA